MLAAKTNPHCDCVSVPHLTRCSFVQGNFMCRKIAVRRAMFLKPTSVIYFIKTPLNQRCELITFYTLFVFLSLHAVSKLVYRDAAFFFSLIRHSRTFDKCDAKRSHDDILGLLWCSVLFPFVVASDRLWAKALTPYAQTLRWLRSDLCKRVTQSKLVPSIKLASIECANCKHTQSDRKEEKLKTAEWNEEVRSECTRIKRNKLNEIVIYYEVCCNEYEIYL